MIIPTALIAGSTAVYGDEFMQKNYLPVVGIPKERVKSITSQEETITLGEGLELRFCQAAGHAPHHIFTSMWIGDEKAATSTPAICEGLFVGDSFGAEYLSQRGYTTKANKVCCAIYYDLSHSFLPSPPTSPILVSLFLSSFLLLPSTSSRNAPRRSLTPSGGTARSILCSACTRGCSS